MRTLIALSLAVLFACDLRPPADVLCGTYAATLNPSFETWGGEFPSGWIAAPNTISQTGAAFSGSSALLFGFSHTELHAASVEIPVAPGIPYVVASAYNSNGTSTGSPGTTIYRVDIEWIGETTVTALLGNRLAPPYRHIGGSVISPTGATAAKLHLVKVANSTDFNLIIDDVVMHPNYSALCLAHASADACSGITSGSIHYGGLRIEEFCRRSCGCPSPSYALMHEATEIASWSTARP